MQPRNSWQIQRAVFLALFIRELKTRFGGYRLGLFWALIEPVMHIIVLTVLFSLIDRDGFFGVPFALFFATGIVSYFIFQKITTSAISSINANFGLFAYRQVKPFDAIIVRASLELLILLSVMVFLTWIGIWFFKLNAFPNDLFYVMVVIALLFTMSVGLALIASVVGVKYPEMAQLITMIMRPLYFISGIIFPLQAMPQEYHVYLLWNPLLHAIEQFRSGWIDGYPATETNLIYVVYWALPVLFLGLAYYRNNRIRVLTS